MPANSKVHTDFGKGRRGKRPLFQRNTSDSASRLVAAPELMGSGNNLALPRLDGVPVEHSLCAGDEPSVALAKTLLKLDIAVPEDWEKAKHDPTAYIGLTLGRWIAMHVGPAIRRRFALTAAITSCLDDFTDRDGRNPNLLLPHLGFGPFRLRRIQPNAGVAGETSPSVSGDVFSLVRRGPEQVDPSI